MRHYKNKPCKNPFKQCQQEKKISLNSLENWNKCWTTFFSHAPQIMRVMEYWRRLTICFNNKFGEAGFCLFKKHKFITCIAFSIYILSLFSIRMTGQNFPYLLHYFSELLSSPMLYCALVFVFVIVCCTSVHYNVTTISLWMFLNNGQYGYRVMVLILYFLSYFHF